MEKSCESCASRKELYLRYGYGLDASGIAYCLSNQTIVAPRTACGKWRAKREERADLILQLRRAEEELASLQKIFKQ